MMECEKDQRSESGDLPKAAETYVENRHAEEAIRGTNQAMDKAIDRKFDYHIVPWIFGIWLFAFIDRSNIGNAKIVGLPEELGIAQGTGYNIALLVFYIPYILVDVPSNWIVKRVKAGTYLPALITSWGMVCTFLGFTKSLAGLIVCRLLLGMFEGGLLGGIVVYLAMFYPRHQMMRRIGYFYCAAPLSGAFGGLLATGLSQIRHGGFNRWPWIFFIEGIITTVFGIICFFTMPHTPAHAGFLTDGEKKRALERMKVDSHGAMGSEDVNEERFDWHWVKMAFEAPQTWFCSLIWFFLLVPLYSFSLFLPAIITGLGYTNPTTAQLFTVPPNMAAFFFVIGFSFFSDHVKFRGPLMAVNCVVAMAGYILLLTAKSNGARYAGTFLAAVGVFPNSALIMGWMSNNLAPHYVRATGVGFLIAFANCSAFLSTFIYLQKDAPAYVLGHSISLGALVLCMLTVLAQIAYLRWENHQRSAGRRDARLDSEDRDSLGHRHPRFLYTL